MDEMTGRVLFVHNMPPETTKPSGIFVYEQFKLMNSTFQNLEMEEISVYSNKGVFSKYLSFGKLVKRIKAFEPDVLHAHFGLTLIPVSLSQLFSKKIPVVITFHGSDLNGSFFVRFLSNLFCFLSKSRVVVVSKKMISRLWKVNRKQVSILPCALCLPEFRSEVTNIQDITLLFPANPNRKEKNFPGFMAIVEELQKSEFCVSVIFLSSVDKKNVGYFLEKTDAVVLVSHSEGSPQIVKEALFKRKPVFSLNVGDVEEMVGTIDGCIVANNVNSLINTIKQLNVSEMGLAAKDCNQALAAVSPKFVAEKLCDIYQLGRD